MPDSVPKGHVFFFTHRHSIPVTLALNKGIFSNGYHFNVGFHGAIWESFDIEKAKRGSVGKLSNYYARGVN